MEIILTSPFFRILHHRNTGTSISKEGVFVVYGGSLFASIICRGGVKNEHGRFKGTRISFNREFLIIALQIKRLETCLAVIRSVLHMKPKMVEHGK